MRRIFRLGQGKAKFERAPRTMVRKRLRMSLDAVISEKDKHGGYRQAVKTQGCGSCIRGFESHYPPHKI